MHPGGVESERRYGFQYDIESLAAALHVLQLPVDASCQFRPPYYDISTAPSNSAILREMIGSPS